MLTDKELETVYVAYLNIWEADETKTGRKVAEGLRQIYNKYSDGPSIAKPVEKKCEN